MLNAVDTRYVRRNLPLYFVFQFFTQFALWNGIWIKYLLDDRGLELKYILLMDLPFWLLVAALEAPSGALADRIGRKRVMGIGGLLMALTILGFGLTTNYWTLFAVYMLWAVAQAMQSGADGAMLYDSLKSAGRENEYARWAGRGMATLLAAGMVSVVLGGLLAELTSLAFVVQVSCIAPLLAMLVAFRMFEPPAFAPQSKKYLRDMRDSFRFAWNHKPVRYSVLMFSIMLTGTFGPAILVQPFLSEHDVATGFYGVFQAPLRLTAVVAALLAFRLSASLGPARIFVGAGSAMILAYSGLALFNSTFAFVFFAFPGFIQGVVRPVIDAYINDRTPSEKRATVLSLAHLGFALQVAWFEPVLGFLTDDWALRAAFAFAAIYFALLMPPMVFLWRRAHRQHTGETNLTLTPAVAEPG